VAFEREIIECKYNEIIIKNRLTMAEYELKMAERERGVLADKLARVKEDLLSSGLMVHDLKQQNEQLREEVVRLGRQVQGEMKAAS
jgi:hypothetical protein